jgi:hypothetical protein
MNASRSGQLSGSRKLIAVKSSSTRFFSGVPEMTSAFPAGIGG